MKQKQFYIFILSLLLCLTGCGRSKELDEYKSNMETFYSDISQYDSMINSIDAESDHSTEELLAALDSMEERFSWMADLPVPNEFSSAESLAADAAASMKKAVSLYHQAFESEPFDSNAAQTAKENYDHANERLRSILSILHGDVPGENDVTDIPEIE